MIFRSGGCTRPLRRAGEGSCKRRVMCVVESPCRNDVIFLQDLHFHQAVLVIGHESETFLNRMVTLAQVSCEQAV